MVDASEAPRDVSNPAIAITPFALALKGWRSQLRWAMTQREEDPARVWLEVISIDERSKRAVAESHDPVQLAELARFRERLESSIASLTDELGDENVAPLYSWLDLVRQRRALSARVDEAIAAVTQARALRAPDAAKAPEKEEAAATQLARAQRQLEEWVSATPPSPPPEVAALWARTGGDANERAMPRDAQVVGKRGDEARRLLARAAGRAPGKHPWPGSRLERISVPAMALAAALLGLFASSTRAASPSIAAILGALSVSSFAAFVALIACGVLARRHEREEVAASLDWVWHHHMYQERARLAELEAGWLRALVDALKARRTFDSKAGTGGQLREFERWRPDLIELMTEVARDTDRGETAS